MIEKTWGKIWCMHTHFPAKCKHLGPTSTLRHLFKDKVINTGILCNTMAMNALFQKVGNVGIQGYVSLRGLSTQLLAVQATRLSAQ